MTEFGDRMRSAGLGVRFETAQADAFLSALNTSIARYHGARIYKCPSGIPRMSIFAHTFLFSLLCYGYMHARCSGRLNGTIAAIPAEPSSWKKYNMEYDQTAAEQYFGDVYGRIWRG